MFEVYAGLHITPVGFKFWTSAKLIQVEFLITEGIPFRQSFSNIQKYIDLDQGCGNSKILYLPRDK